MKFARLLKALAMIRGVIVLVAGVNLLSAQYVLKLPEAPPGSTHRLFRDAAPIAPEELLSTCPAVDLPLDECSEPFVRQVRCEVEGPRVLGVVEGNEYFEVNYRSSGRYEGESYDCVENMRLVAEKTPDGWVPVWFDSTADTYLFVTEIRLLQIRDHSLLVVSYLMNGTGGGWEEIFVLQDGKWREIKVDYSEAMVDVPEEFGGAKSPGIDFESMTWQVNFATDGDPNCCPSGSLLLELDLVDGHFVVTSHHFRVRGADWRWQRLQPAPAK